MLANVATEKYRQQNSKIILEILKINLVVSKMNLEVMNRRSLFPKISEIFKRVLKVSSIDKRESAVVHDFKASLIPSQTKV